MRYDAQKVAEGAKGWLEPAHGQLLYETAKKALAPHGSTNYISRVLEIGAYCGKSTIYLAEAASECDSFVFSVDHHRGSQEHQPGQAFYDDTIFDPLVGQVDTLQSWRRNLWEAGLERSAVAIVARSEDLAHTYIGYFRMIFIDGGHDEGQVRFDFDMWTQFLTHGGFVALHDVTPGMGPHAVYERAIASTRFEHYAEEGSLKILEKVK